MSDAKFYFCRNGECFSKPWRVEDGAPEPTECPYCNSNNIHGETIEWLMGTSFAFAEPSPEQRRIAASRKARA